MAAGDSRQSRVLDEMETAALKQAVEVLRHDAKPDQHRVASPGEIAGGLQTGDRSGSGIAHEAAEQALRILASDIAGLASRQQATNAHNQHRYKPSKPGQAGADDTGRRPSCT